MGNDAQLEAALRMCWTRRVITTVGLVTRAGGNCRGTRVPWDSEVGGDPAGGDAPGLAEATGWKSARCAVGEAPGDGGMDSLWELPAVSKRTSE